MREWPRIMRSNLYHGHCHCKWALGAPRSIRICVVLTLPALAAHISRSIVSAPLPSCATKRRDWAGGAPGLPTMLSVTTCSSKAAGSSCRRLRSRNRLERILSYLRVQTQQGSSERAQERPLSCATDTLIPSF